MPLPWLIAGGVAVGLAALLSEDEETKKMKGEFEKICGSLKRLHEGADGLLTHSKELLEFIDTQQRELFVQDELVLSEIIDLQESISNLKEIFETIMDSIKTINEHVEHVWALAEQKKWEVPEELSKSSIDNLQKNVERQKRKYEICVENMDYFIETYIRYRNNELQEYANQLIVNLEGIISELEYVLKLVNRYTTGNEIDKENWNGQESIDLWLKKNMEGLSKINQTKKQLEQTMDGLLEVVEQEGREIDYSKWDASIKKYENLYQKIILQLGHFHGKHEQIIRERSIFDGSSEVSIAVIAPMSSGKSTVINAMLGTELLPSKNEACTATITTIIDVDEAIGFTAELFDKENNYLETIQDVNAQILEQLNERTDVYKIQLKGDIKSIRTNDRRVELIDTPGPNNSYDLNHFQITNDLLESNSFHIILYILNVTQLGIQDDSDLMQHAIHVLRESKRGNRDERVIFVLNKCDELDPEDGEGIEEVLRHVREYLREQSIENPLIVPTSAYMARLIRQKQNDEMLTRKEKRELESYITDSEMQPLEEFAEIPHALKMQLSKQLEMAKKYNDVETVALIHTGIPSLEALIENLL